jgi:ParB-like chromosome segregation protein Spo0J
MLVVADTMPGPPRGLRGLTSVDAVCVEGRAAVSGAEIHVSVDDLRAGWSPRIGGERAEHVDALVESGGAWPPLLVERSTMMVIDGIHRLAAARRLGLRRIAVRFFEGTSQEVRLEAIRVNTRHGLPLTLAERRVCGTAVLRDHPEWSDRRIAEICGLSPKTVAVLRETALVGEDLRQDRRVGRDGRARPVRDTDARRRAAAALAENPDASLRVIARRAGTSPETVRAVRTSMPPERGRNAGPVRPACPPEPDAACRLSGDAAFSSTSAGLQFSDWFDRVIVNRDDVAAFVDAIPLSRIYEVVDEARRRAAVWESFAVQLEKRAR